MSALIVGSLPPGSAKERIGASTSEAESMTYRAGYRHRLIHVLTFGSARFLVSLLAWNRREESQAAGEVSAIGCLVELTQDIFYSHGNLFEWWDVRDDAIGIALAFVTIQLIHRTCQAAVFRRKAPASYSDLIKPDVTELQHRTPTGFEAPFSLIPCSD
jgi:hypothetical protein